MIHDTQIISTPEGEYVIETPSSGVVIVTPFVVGEAACEVDTGSENLARFVFDTGVNDG